VIIYPTKSLDRNKNLNIIRNHKKVQYELIDKLLNKEELQSVNKKVYITELKAKETKDVKFAEEKLYIKHEKIIKKKKQELIEDDKFTRRINIVVGGCRYQLRVQTDKNRRHNAAKQKNANTPNSTHSLDASIIQQVILCVKNLGIPCAYIHDSIGTSLGSVPIAAYMYRFQILEIIEKALSGIRLPPYQSSPSYSFCVFDYKRRVINSRYLIN
jgi:DNA-directed RNA polymerase